VVIALRSSRVSDPRKPMDVRVATVDAARVIAYIVMCVIVARQIGKFLKAGLRNNSYNCNNLFFGIVLASEVYAANMAASLPGLPKWHHELHKIFHVRCIDTPIVYGRIPIQKSQNEVDDG
jgi:hypothetical protein